MSEAEAERVPDTELVELFRRRRPDPEAFRKRVAERIREREQHPESGSQRGASLLRSEFVRRAAAFLPLDPAGGVGLGKVLATSLALPFLVLFASVGALAAAGRSVLRSASSARPAAREPRTVRDVARSPARSLRVGRHLGALLQTLGTFALLLPSITGSPHAVDIVIALVLASAAALVLVVRGLAESTLLTPRSVGTYATSILGALFAGAFLWPLSRRAAEAGSDLGLGWSAGVVLLGIVACALLPRGRTGGIGWFWLLFAPVLVLLNPLGLTRSSPASLQGQVVGLELETRELQGWEALGLLAEALTATGTTVPPLPAVEQALEAELARGLEAHALAWRAGVDAHARVWTAADQAGLMTLERWCRLAERPSEARKLDQLSTLTRSDALRMPSYDEYQVAMLVATRELTPEQRAALATRIEAAWPVTGEHDALGSALLLVRLLDRLGLPERADARRADVHALLVEHWFDPSVRLAFQPAGGFTPNPQAFRTSLPDPTHSAVALMARFGVPEEIDLRRVRAYLRAESAAFWLVIPEPAHLKATQRAALLRLERELGIPPRPLLATLAGERVLIACVLLVALCVLAIRSAPRVGSAQDRRALP